MGSSEAPPRGSQQQGQAQASYVHDAFDASEAMYVRPPATQRTVPRGWEEIHHPDPLGADLRIADAAHLRSPNGHEFVAFRGTDMNQGFRGIDWTNNRHQITGADAPKYDAAARIGEAFRDDPHVSFTGHSLGGGLAKLAAEKASMGREGETVAPKTAVTFNSAWLASPTLDKHGCELHHQKATAIQIENNKDVLTYMHEMIPTNVSGPYRDAPGAVKRAAYGAMGFVVGTALATAGQYMGSPDLTQKGAEIASGAAYALGKSAVDGVHAYQTEKAEIAQARASSNTYTVKVGGTGDYVWSYGESGVFSKPQAVTGHSMTGFDTVKAGGPTKLTAPIVSESHTGSGPAVAPGNLVNYDALAPAQRSQVEQTLQRAASESLERARTMQHNVGVGRA